MRRRARRAGLGALLALAAASAGVLAAQAPFASSRATGACSSGQRIERTFKNGALWRLCWEVRPQEGIVLREMFFRASRKAPTRRILGRASLSQIHVPYDDDLARFHDLSDFGFGANATAVTRGQCGGKLLSDGRTNIGCTGVEASNDSRYRFGSTQRQGQNLVIWSSAQIGLYNYTVRWQLGDDGSITPGVGASGQLQRLGGDAKHGWDIGSAARPEYAVSHVHSYWFRLDFDLAGIGGDRIEQIQFDPAADGAERELSRTALTTEQGVKADAVSSRSWRVVDANTNADGHRMSYDILPNADSIYRGPSYEGFTQNELWATVDKACERFASHNNVVDPNCPGADVAAFANGEPLAGKDVVLWYGLSFHHLPRDEEEPRMASHWSEFTMIPRDMTSRTPGVVSR